MAKSRSKLNKWRHQHNFLNFNRLQNYTAIGYALWAYQLQTLKWQTILQIQIIIGMISKFVQSFKAIDELEVMGYCIKAQLGVDQNLYYTLHFKVIQMNKWKNECTNVMVWGRACYFPVTEVSNNTDFLWRCMDAKNMFLCLPEWGEPATPGVTYQAPLVKCYTGTTAYWIDFDLDLVLVDHHWHQVVFRRCRVKLVKICVHWDSPPNTLTRRHTQGIEPMLDQYWASVVDGGPTLIKHSINVRWLVGRLTSERGSCLGLMGSSPRESEGFHTK